MIDTLIIEELAYVFFYFFGGKNKKGDTISYRTGWHQP